MHFTISTSSPTSVPCHWLVVGLWEKALLPLSAAAIDQATGGVISDLVARGDITGKLPGDRSDIGTIRNCRGIDLGENSLRAE